MALSYDIRALPAHTKEGAGWQTTETIIFLCALVDLGEIKATNIKEWRVRLRMTSALTGHDYSEIEDALKDRVGLRTNVMTRTRAAFARDLGDRIAARIPE